MACCVAVGLSSAAQTQSPADSSDDQAKALEALRQAEHTAPAETPAKPAKKKKNHEGHESHESAADSGMGLGSTAHAPHASERISRKDAEAQSKKNERDTDGQTHVLLCACVLA